MLSRPIHFVSVLIITLFVFPVLSYSEATKEIASDMGALYGGDQIQVCSWADVTTNFSHSNTDLAEVPEGETSVRGVLTGPGGFGFYNTNDPSKARWMSAGCSWAVSPQDFSDYHGGALRFWLLSHDDLFAVIELNPGQTRVNVPSTNGVWEEIVIPLGNGGFNFSPQDLTQVQGPFLISSFHSAGTDFYLDHIRWTKPVTELEVTPESVVVKPGSSTPFRAFGRDAAGEDLIIYPHLTLSPLLGTLSQNPAAEFTLEATTGTFRPGPLPRIEETGTLTAAAEGFGDSASIVVSNEPLEDYELSLYGDSVSSNLSLSVIPTHLTVDPQWTGEAREGSNSIKSTIHTGGPASIGWSVAWASGPHVNTRDFFWGSLRFWFKAPASLENKLEVGIETTPRTNSQVNLSDYVEFDNEWHPVVIPIANFTLGYDLVETTKLFQISLSESVNGPVDFFVDDIRMDTRIPGPLARIDVIPGNITLPGQAIQPFEARGFDANDIPVDIWPIWSFGSSSLGTLDQSQGKFVNLTAQSGAVSGTLDANVSSNSAILGQAQVNINGITLPPAVTNLTAVSNDQIEVTWSVPVQPSGATIQSYDLRWSNSPIQNMTEFNAANVVSDSLTMAPQLPGNIESLQVIDLVPGAMHYFGIVYVDEYNRQSLIASNPNAGSVAGFFETQEDIINVGNANNTLDWFDYQSDGDPDLYVDGQPRTLYTNQNGYLALNNTANFGWIPGDRIWLDVDNDGDEDLIGVTYVSTRERDLSLWTSEFDVFTKQPNPIVPEIFENPKLATGDIDNDGDSDLVVIDEIVFDSGQAIENSAVYLNVNGQFQKDLNQPNIYPSGDDLLWRIVEVLLVDIDSDGDLDLLSQFINHTNYGGHKIRLQLNVDGIFQPHTEVSEISSNFVYTGMKNVDVDANGEIDLLVFSVQGGGAHLEVFSNNRGVLARTQEIEFDNYVINGIPAFGDWDNDGDVDMAHVTSENIQIYLNNAGQFSLFSKIRSPLTYDSYLNVDWMDYENDGDLDLIVLTHHGSPQSEGQFLKVFENKLADNGDVNTPPTSPAGSQLVASSESIRFTWDPASDVQSSMNNLYYNVRVGTSPNGSEIVSGVLSEPFLGNYLRPQLDANTLGIELHGQFDGLVYASVQTIDAGYNQSEWSEPVVVSIGASPFELVSNEIGEHWVDYDGDGDLDLSRSKSIFENHNGNLIDAGISFGGTPVWTDHSWVDYDHDGDLDVIAIPWRFWSDKTVHFYKNNNGSFDFDPNHERGTIIEGNLTMGDIDNDGDQDFFASGLTCVGSPCFTSFIYKNVDGRYEFHQNIQAGGINRGEFADYDQDGDLDLFISLGGLGASIAYYENVDGQFNEQTYITNTLGEVKLLNFDQDDDLDLVIAGFDGLHFYRNDDGQFDFLNLIPSAFGVGNLNVGDMDNDGDSDVVLSDRDQVRIHFNNNGSFETEMVIFNGSTEHISLGDYDSDGDLDIATSTGIFRNNRDQFGSPNMPPQVPTNIVRTLFNGGFVLTWDPAVDEESSIGDVNYNVRVGLTPGGSEIRSGLLGDRLRGSMMSMGGNFRNYIFKDIPPGTYYASVQSIDAGYALSPWSDPIMLTIEGNDEPPVTEEAVVGLTFSTFFEMAAMVKTDSEGYIYVYGTTVYDPEIFPDARTFGPMGERDVYIGKMSPDGAELEWITFIGGSDMEYSGRDGGLEISGDGTIYFAGASESVDFPVTPDALPAILNPRMQAVILRLSPNGDSLLYSTLMGGMDKDHASDLELDSDGNLFISGRSASPDFPGVINEYGGGIGDGFVAKFLTPNMTLAYSRFIGGSYPLLDRGGGEETFALSIDDDGNAYACTLVHSTDVVTTPGAYDRTFGGIQDGHITKLDPNGNIIFATYFGGSDWDVPCWGMGIDSGNNLYFGGFTGSEDYPTHNAEQSTMRGFYDGVLTKLDSAGNIVFSTFIGGDGEEELLGLDIDQYGNAYLAGNTRSHNFETTENAFQSQRSNDSQFQQDSFFRIYNANGSILYSTFLGGSQNAEKSRDVAVDSDGNVIIAGYQAGDDFPTTHGAYLTQGDGSNPFIVKFFVNNLLAHAGFNQNPLDTRGDGNISGADILTLQRHHGRSEGDSNWNNCFDTNLDGTIDQLDGEIIQAAYGSRPGDSNWDVRADINGCLKETVWMTGHRSLLAGNPPHTFTWREGENILYSGEELDVQVELVGLGVHTIDLTLTNGDGEQSTDQVQITIQPFDALSSLLEANAGSDQIVIDTKGNGFINGAEFTLWQNHLNLAEGDEGYSNCYDTNLDGIIDDLDYDVWAAAYGSREGDSHWNPLADTDGCLKEIFRLDASSTVVWGPNPIEYVWREGNVVLHRSSNPVADVLIRGIGEHIIDLVVSNGDDVFRMDQVVVQLDPWDTVQSALAVSNEIPVAHAGRNQAIFELNADGYATVTLDASQSYDPDGEIATYVWGRDEGMIYQGPESHTIVLLPEGTHNFFVSVWDKDGAHAEDETEVRVEDINEAPLISLSIPSGIEAERRRAISAYVQDDGLPKNAQMTTQWELVSGPGEVVIEEPEKTETFVKFASGGNYIMRFSASDGKKSSFKNTEVEVKSVRKNRKRRLGVRGRDRNKIEIPIHVNKPSAVRVVILDADANPIQTVFVGQKESGTHIIPWNKKNVQNSDAASGIYYADIQIGNQTERRKLVVIR